jgi:hypothetical protein
MNSRTIFWRLVWKEFRQFRAFAGALLAAGFVLLLLAILMGKAQNSHEPTASYIAILFPILFVAGCAATSFSMEHEQNTFLWQRLLPVRLWQICWSKIFHTLVTASTIFVLLCCALLLIGGSRQFQFEGASILFYGLVTLEFLAWGTLFSLIDRQPLRAVALSIICAMTVLGLSAALSILVHGKKSGLPAGDMAGFWLRIVVLATLVVVDLKMAKRWFHEGSGNSPLAGLLHQVVWRPKLRATTETLSGAAGTLYHLCWLQLRVSALPMLLFVIIAMAIHGHIATSVVKDGTSLPSVAYAICSILIGGLTFNATRERREFLALQGISGSRLWLSQIIAPLLIGLLACLFIWAPFSAHSPFHDLRTFTVLLVLTGIAYGQWGSQIAPSSLTAIGTGILLSSLAFAWILLMDWLSVSRWLCVYPLILIPFVITLLNSHRWLLNRRMPVIERGASAIPFVAIAIGFILFRMFEVPAVDQNELARAIALNRTADPAQVRHFREMADAISRGWSNSRTEDEIDQFQKRSLPAILESDWNFQIAEISDFELADFRRSETILFLLNNQLASAIEEKRIDDGKQILLKLLDFKDYMYIYMYSAGDSAVAWASIPGNSSENVLHVLSAVQHKLAIGRDESSDRLRYRSLKAAIDLDSDWSSHENRFIYSQNSQAVELYRRFHAIAFWENIRQHRILDWQTIKRAEARKEILAQIEKGKALFDDLPTTNAASSLHKYPLVFEHQSPQVDDISWQIRCSYYHLEASFRALQIQLALKAWQLDHHGELPKKLAELSGKYLDAVPNDPFTAESFYYFPNGMKVKPDSLGAAWPDRSVKRAGKDRTAPFLWSPDPIYQGTNYPNQFVVGNQASSLTWEQIRLGRIYVLEPPEDLEPMEEIGSESSNDEVSP